MVFGIPVLILQSESALAPDDPENVPIGQGVQDETIESHCGKTKTE